MQDWICVKHKDWTPPEKAYYTILAKNGAFMVKMSPVIHAVKPVEFSRILESVTGAVTSDKLLKQLAGEFLKILEPITEIQEEIVEWVGPRIPAAITTRAVTFLRVIKEQKNTEAILYVLYSPQHHEYRLSIPEQSATMASVHTLEPVPTEDGWLIAVSMHGHPDNAFHSGVDCEDEQKADGVHIVVGKLKSALPEFSCYLVAFGQRHKWDINEILENPFEIPNDWLNKVQTHS